MSFLSKNQILDAQDLSFRDVPVPEWKDSDGNPGMVRVAGLSAKEASVFSSKLVSVDAKGGIKELKMDNFMAELLARTLVNESFEPLFSEIDIEALGKKSAAVMKRLSDIAMELSGLSDQSLKDATKN